MGSRRSYAAAVAVGGGELLVLGGWDGDGERRLESVEALRIRGGAPSGGWRRVPDMSCPRYGLAAAVVPGPAAPAAGRGSQV